MTGVLLALAAVVGCGGGQEARELWDASLGTTFASAVPLGPHRMEVVTVRSRELTQAVTPALPEGTPPATPPPDVVQERFELRFNDWSAFQHTTWRNGAVLQELRVVGDGAWVRSGQGAWRRLPDAETLRADLRYGADPWLRSLEPFLGDLEADYRGRSVVEGRPAFRYDLAPADDPGAVLTLEAAVELDGATAVPLIGQLRGSWTTDARVEAIEVRLQRTDLGNPQAIEVPDGATPLPPPPRRPAPPRIATPGAGK